MPRLQLRDRLQNFRFHLFDVSWGLTIPPYVFEPLGSFSSITAPELNLETEELAVGNDYFKTHLVTGGSCSNITLSRGASFFDSEFWRWTAATVKGNVSDLFPPVFGGHRRDLMLVQFTGYSALGAQQNAALQAVASVAAGFLPEVGGVLRVPAKAWLMKDCLPVRYKVSGDFDATSSDVSIQELEISMHLFEEFNVI